MQRRRIALGLIAGVISEAANKLIPLATLHLAATRLGVKPFGVSQFSQWLTDLGVYFVAFGFAAWAPLAWRSADQNGAKDQMDRARVFSSVTLMRLLHALVACLVLSFVVQDGSTWSEYRWILLPTLFIVVTSAFDCLWAITYLRAIPLFSGISIAAKVISLIAIVSMVQGPGDALKYTVILQSANAALSMASFVYVWRVVGWAWPSIAQLAVAFRGSLPFAVSAFLLVAIERLDMALVESALGAAGAGAYGGPMKIAISMMPIAGMVTTVFFAEMLNVFENESMLRHLQAVIRVAVVLLAPVAVGMWFVYLDVVPLILGPEFAAYAKVLPILSSCIVAQMFMIIFGSQVLALRGRVALYNWALLAGVVVVAGSASILGARFGLEGFALASAAGRWVAALLAGVFGLMIIGDGRRRIILETMRSFIPAAVMTGVLLLLPQQSWIASIVIGGTVYGAIAGILFRGTIASALSARAGS